MTRIERGVGIAWALALLVWAAPPTTSAASATAIHVEWRPDARDTNRVVAEVTGVPASALTAMARPDRTIADWQRVFPVRAESGGPIELVDLPPMTGKYRISGDRLLFEPAFAPSPGVGYRAIFRPAALEGFPADATPVEALHRRSTAVAASSTVVSQVYPSPAVLPENLLKFYLHFSSPMSRGDVYDHIHLRRADGEVIVLPFLELDEELWNASMTRLTLLLDPGRIKRGVRPLEEVGPALEAGKSYVLAIDREWPDASGQPLKTGFEKAFSVGPSDREPPDPQKWNLMPPHTGTREALKVRFPKPLDHAVTLRLLRVVDEAGRAIEGISTLSGEESEWSFVPGDAWRAGGHRLVVPPVIEDLAGNNPGKPFDVDLTEEPDRAASSASASPATSLAFVVR